MPEATSAAACLPALPAARGPYSATVLARLRDEAAPALSFPVDADPLGEDIQLALYLTYELHYRGFVGVDPTKEWDPAILNLRRDLEDRFEGVLRASVSPSADVQALRHELAALGEPLTDGGPSAFLARQPDRDRLRELIAHRSLYHLKEADPQAFVLPRLTGAAKSLVAGVLFDEFGGGNVARSHNVLFADLMRDLDLVPDYGAYLDAVPAPMLALVNFMSWCGLHRRLRGALIGHLALVELTSPAGSQRMVRVLAAHGAGPAAERFYAEHVVADAVHERVIREAIDDLVAAEPELVADVVFGIRAALLLEDRLDRHLLDSWTAGRSSLHHAI